MKVSYTQIVGVESDQSTVRIHFRPQGSDASDRPVQVQISPHDKYIYLNLSCMGCGKQIGEVVHGANTAEIHFGEPVPC